jgi:hypothetical protein
MILLNAPTRTPEAELERTAIFGSEQERSLAAELLRLRAGVRRMRGKLGMYDPVKVREAWVIAAELLEED